MTDLLPGERRHRPGRPLRRPVGPVALALLLALAGAAASLPAAAQARPPRAAAPAVSPAISALELASRHGLRVDRVTVTGSGGLVDLRFTILDPAKARPLLEGMGHELLLVAEPGGETLQAPHHGAMRNVRLAKDAPCFVLFPNARGAVRPGGRAAVAFGEVRVQAVTVQ